jgi:hypothetical protein
MSSGRKNPSADRREEERDRRGGGWVTVDRRSCRQGIDSEDRPGHQLFEKEQNASLVLERIISLEGIRSGGRGQGPNDNPR